MAKSRLSTISSLLGIAGTYMLYAFPALRAVAASETHQCLIMPRSAGPESSPGIAPKGWKTYRGEAYGYTVAYPPSWTANIYLANGGTPAGTKSYVIQQGVAVHARNGPGAGLVYVDVFRNTSRFPLLRWVTHIYAPAVSTYSKPGTLQGIPIPRRTNDFIGGKPALRLEKQKNQSVASKQFYVANGSYIYRISIFLDSSDLFNGVYLNMLHSFRFTR